ncbi:hypothetical protein [Cytobacillus dafuensis]|nr:hypothetical protein [Cytobacillus dafuensis]
MLWTVLAVKIEVLITVYLFGRKEFVKVESTNISALWRLYD